MISTRTVRWQCSGCDRLCAMLLDELIVPDEIIVCKKAKPLWRIEVITAKQNETP